MSSIQSTNHSSLSSDRRPAATVAGTGDDEVDHSNPTIHLEQAIARTIELYARLGDQLHGTLGLSPERMSVTDSLSLLGVGSSQYAAMAGAHLMGEVADIAATAYSAEEVALAKDDLPQSAILLAHAGESMQTLAALRYLLMHDIRTVSVTNTPSSLLVRESNGFLPTREHIKGVCENSHTFSLQFVALYWLAHHYAYHRGTCTHQVLTSSLDQIRTLLENLRCGWIEQKTAHARMVERIAVADSIVIVGKEHEYAVALEAATQLIEIAHKSVVVCKTIDQSMAHKPSLVIILGADAHDGEPLDAAGIERIVVDSDNEKADILLPQGVPLLNPLAISLTMVRWAQQVAAKHQPQVGDLQGSTETHL